MELFKKISSHLTECFVTSLTEYLALSTEVPFQVRLVNTLVTPLQKT